MQSWTTKLTDMIQSDLCNKYDDTHGIYLKTAKTSKFAIPLKFSHISLLRASPLHIHTSVHEKQSRSQQVFFVICVEEYHYFVASYLRFSIVTIIYLPSMDLIHQMPLESTGPFSTSGGESLWGVLCRLLTSYPSSLALSTSWL